MGKTLITLSLASALLTGCVTTQPTDESTAAPRALQTVTAMTAAERAEGAKAHPQLLAEFGGLYNGPQAAYVTQVGRRIAVQSSLSSQQQDFTISLLNSSVNNAFAIPGGYVYVTRQLMALMNDEAELAGVLGHEIGHVAAQHSKKRQATAQRNSILGVIGQVLVAGVAGNGAVGDLLQRSIGSGVQLLTLKFSRTQEYEADDLGIRYLARAGYDPTALSDMLASLAAQTQLDSEVSGNPGSIPEWASTHPDPASRVQRALIEARATGSTSTVRNKAMFLDHLDGLLYGDDPDQGIVSSGEFLDRALKLKFSVPAGFTVDNRADSVSINGTSARAQFSGGPFDGDLDGDVRSVFGQLAGQGGQVPAIALQHSTVNGLPVAWGRLNMANQQGTSLTVTVVSYAFAPRLAYHFIVATPAGQGLGSLAPMVNSVARMSDSEAAAIKPRRIHLVSVAPGDTVSSLSGRMAYADHQLERFLVLNGLSAHAVLAPGSKVKLVTF